MLLPDVIFDPRPALAVVKPDKPTGFWLLDAVAGLPLVLCAVDPILAVDGPVEFDFARKAAHALRPLAEEEAALALLEFPETVAEG